MCGRYTFSDQEQLADYYDLLELPDDLRSNFNVSPSQIMPVVTNDGSSNRIEKMQWGIPRFIGPGKVKDVFNTRDDKAFTSWKKMTMTQRVLIPATSFYEWKKPERQRYFIHLKDQSLFSFAGIWNAWEDKETGNVINAYSIITTKPNNEMSSVHDRMPVILHHQDEALWLSEELNNNQDAIESLLRPYDNDGLELVKDDRDIKLVKSNKEIIDSLNSK